MAAGLVFAWLGYVVTSEKPSFQASVFDRRIVLHGLYGAMAIAHLVYLGWRRRLPGPTRLDWPIAGLILVYVVATADSIYPRLSLETALLIGQVVIALYAFTDFEFLTVPVAVRGLVLVGAAAAAFALYRVGEAYFGWLGLVDAVEGNAGLFRLPPNVLRVEGVGDHVNILAMALNLALPFALVLAVMPARRGERPAAIAAALLMLAALFFTLSRGAWLGAAAGVFVLAAVVLLALGRSAWPKPSRRLAIGLGLASLLAAVVVAAGLSLTWDSRPGWLFRSSLSPREDALDAGWRIFRDRPFLGAGPNTYGLLYNVYSGEFPIENIHAHNGYVQALVDVGVGGALVLAAGGVVLAMAVVPAFREGDRQRRVFIAAVAAASAAFGVHALFDSPNLWKTALMPLALVLALALRLGLPPPRPARRAAVALAPRVAVLLLAPLLIAGWAWVDIRSAPYNDSIHDLARGRFTDAAASAAEAAEGDRGVSVYHMHAGVTKAIVYLVARQRGEDAPIGLLDEAIIDLDRAVAREPRSSFANANLAIANLLRDDLQDAVDAARRAMDLAPRDGTIAAVAGTIFERAALFGEARRAYSLAVTFDASLIDSPFWLSTPFRSDVRADAVADSFLTDCQKARVVATFRGFPDDLESLASGCRTLVGASPGDARARSDLAVALYVLGEEDQARAEAERAVDREPDSAYARTALGIVLNATGDIRAVRKQLMLGAHLGDPDAVLLLAYTYGAGTGQSPPRQNLRILARPDPMPGEVRDLVIHAIPGSAPMVYDNGVQNYLLGGLYYRTRFMRESGTSVLIPGEWLDFASPRALLLIEAATTGPR